MALPPLALPSCRPQLFPTPPELMLIPRGLGLELPELTAAKRPQSKPRCMTGAALRRPTPSAELRLTLC